MAKIQRDCLSEKHYTKFDIICQYMENNIIWNKIALKKRAILDYCFRSNSRQVPSSTTTICTLEYLLANSCKRSWRLLKITLQTIMVPHTATTASSVQMFTHWLTTLNKLSIFHLQSGTSYSFWHRTHSDRSCGISFNTQLRCGYLFK